MKPAKKGLKSEKEHAEGELHLSEVASLKPVLASDTDNQDSSTTQFIRKAVEQTVNDAGQKLIVPRELGKLSPKVLLAIITYCYTKGVYSCGEIEEAILNDSDLRMQLSNEFPDNRSLRRFRRLNREAIRVTLERAFGEAKHKLGHIPPDRLQAAVKKTAEKLGISPNGEETAFLVKQAVEDRIQKALFIDGMTKDLDY